ncbi:hypothetical protein BC827DRAFT_1265613 [Russula dissimulans]|nr:hypothetical protein BC827DRAFT_1265613 [Russula dissimulans]
MSTGEGPPARNTCSAHAHAKQAHGPQTTSSKGKATQGTPGTSEQSTPAQSEQALGSGAQTSDTLVEEEDLVSQQTAGQEIGGQGDLSMTAQDISMVSKLTSTSSQSPSPYAEPMTTSTAPSKGSHETFMARTAGIMKARLEESTPQDNDPERVDSPSYDLEQEYITAPASYYPSIEGSEFESPLDKGKSCAWDTLPQKGERSWDTSTPSPRSSRCEENWTLLDETVAYWANYADQSMKEVASTKKELTELRLRVINTYH